MTLLLRRTGPPECFLSHGGWRPELPCPTPVPAGISKVLPIGFQCEQRVGSWTAILLGAAGIQVGFSGATDPFLPASPTVEAPAFSDYSSWPSVAPPASPVPW